MLNSGIYCIYNTITDDFYIGQAVNIRRRFYRHRWDLDNSKHCNRILQRAWKKYGGDAFEFKILAFLDQDREILTVFEQIFIDNLKPVYNISPTASSNLGVKHTEERNNKIRETKRANGISECARTSLSNRMTEYNLHKKEYKFTDAYRDKLSIGHSGGKTFSFISPEDEVFTGIVNLTRFCQQHGLSVSNMHTLHSGKSQSCKGWRKFPTNLL